MLGNCEESDSWKCDIL